MPHQSYRLSSFSPVLSHMPAVQPLVRDMDSDDMSHLLFEARLRSGDYFVTLATEIEKLAELMEQEDIPEAAYLQRISAELTYLDKHYHLISK